MEQDREYTDLTNLKAEINKFFMLSASIEDEETETQYESYLQKGLSQVFKNDQLSFQMMIPELVQLYGGVQFNILLERLKQYQNQNLQQGKESLSAKYTEELISLPLQNLLSEKNRTQDEIYVNFDKQCKNYILQILTSSQVKQRIINERNFFIKKLLLMDQRTNRLMKQAGDALSSTTSLHNQQTSTLPPEGNNDTSQAN